ncbi:hypothetical protein FRC17_005296, partial [Serendipita sp. 399]
GWIPDVLSVSQSLERLRLYGAGNWIINYARSLLLQTTQNLSKIKACRVRVSLVRVYTISSYYRNGGGGQPCALGVIDKETWESYWEYDEELKCAVRRVYGPVAVEITTVSDPWGVKRRNRETDNVPEEEAMHVDGSVIRYRGILTTRSLYDDYEAALRLRSSPQSEHKHDKGVNFQWTVDKKLAIWPKTRIARHIALAH